MNGVELTRLVEVLTDISLILERLGIPGLVLLALAGPALVLCAVLVIEFHRSRKVQDIAETARADSRGMLETYRAESRALLETYRTDTQQILRELGAGLDQTDQYYRDNVELVKQYEKVSKNLQDVVVGNTSAITRLITMLEERRKGT